MGERSSIEWCHHTFNPWRGCAKVNAGCTNCYAARNVGVAMQGITWGEVWQGGQRVVKAESGWGGPLRWAREAARARVRRRVFCASLADVLEVPSWPPESMSGPEFVAAHSRVRQARDALNAARSRLWDAIRRTAFVGPGGDVCRLPTPHIGHDAHCRFGLDWLLLTKRSEWADLVPPEVRKLVWLGTSISDQKTADDDVPRLLDAQGFRLRFLSVEPLVGPVDLSRWLSPVPGRPGLEFHGGRYGDVRCGIDWVIVGGESGPKARPCQVDWLRDVVRQCRGARVPCFVKQLGAAYSDPDDGVAGAGLVVPSVAAALVARRLVDSKGGDMAEWPEHLRVRELPDFQKGEASHG